ncbi:uncharacterized protein BX664DRAFT_239354, partial [Halteromyces radiatus]|uniref:uncharacterized protein n=1 Tax=Halteromyces radiatus TaxID=101107 RepID=UPI0022201DAF
KHNRSKFGQDAILVMANWSAPMTRYHEPLRGIGMRRMLMKNGFPVFLIDEFRTSPCCPACQNYSLETFHRVPNPRPYRRQQNPTVICHGLLRCTNQTCVEAIRSNGFEKGYRLWNRDLAAALNFLHILRGLREDGVIPARFRRGNAPVVPAPSAPASSTST